MTSAGGGGGGGRAADDPVGEKADLGPAEYSDGMGGTGGAASGGGEKAGRLECLDDGLDVARRGGSKDVGFGGCCDDAVAGRCGGAEAAEGEATRCGAYGSAGAAP